MFQELQVFSRGPVYATARGSPSAFPSTVTAGAAHARSVPTGRQAGCATQQNKLGKTSLGGLYAH